ncbi:alpha-L-arabinofuranosidase C-terminal domain-containing protein [Nocardioides dongkuii]|uniref:alpha-L-arabinofuranosidase C-terminal domain-containing protein n=1 Tax=Nocardioides dongkuii TaxID=2760089 RepID=UPI001878CC78|nr:alpha-L-arabinofuranosidase C-terminal domain-containing protein [Nocardioides dongkuii]
MTFGRRTTAALTAVTTLLGAGVVVVATTVAPAAAAAEPVTWTDTFDGAELDARWEVVNPEPSALAVAGGSLRLEGQLGDTYQTTNTAKNVVMLDVPAGDFTATADVSAAVAKVYQGAGLIAWQDMDNYVRSGLTYVGTLAPSGVAIENDVESGGVFSAVSFTDRPGSSAERLRLQRTGDTITTSYWTGAAWATAGSTEVAFDTTQVGLYALAAQDGSTLPAAFDSFTIEHEAGADVVPSGSFVLQADGDAPYLVADEGALELSADQPTASLRLRATALEDGAVALSSDGRPVVLTGGALRLGSGADQPTPMRITDAGGGNVVLRTDGDPTAYVVAGAGGALVTGAEADAVRFALAEVDDSTATMTIDGDGLGAEISDTMFGIFYEDINWAADGGLYAELVRNRSFEFDATDAAGWTGLTGWQVLDRSAAGTTAQVVDDDGRLNAMNRNYLRLTAAAAGDGVRNLGFDGVALEQGEQYDAYVWARSTTAQSLTVRVEDEAGTGVLATGTVALDGSDQWKKLPVTLTATGTTNAGRVAVLAGAPSTVALDMVSVLPRDTWVGPVNGRSTLRKDLVEKVDAMNPTFLRFPGGCVTNVGTFRTYEESGYTDRQRTYQWKETIGPVEERPTNKNFWGYNQTYGLGYLEYFELAEDLGAEPLPVVSVGANGCGSTIPEMTDPALIQRWVDDTVDLIEFANGDVTTEWGARRAALGHPEPFGLDMIGLGNEENTTTFEANFPAFRDAISSRYPDIAIISNSGPDDAGARFDALWEFNREQDVDLVDEHYYNDPDWFLANNHRYDDYDRDGPKVFLGEYASRGNTWFNALAEASYMTGLQRNADIVRLASYAPLLANDAHVQWSPDAIWFDNDESWESPNWEVQKLFGNNVGDQVVPSTFDGAVNAPAPIDGGIFLSTWATSAAYDDVRVTENDSGDVLFSDDFSSAAQWSPQAGSWAVDGGRYVQSATGVNDARSIITDAYGKDWSNYTLELKATKLAGAEGFMVGFAAGGPNDYYWWNIGGWNNTRSVLQRANGGAANEVVALEGTGVETGQTYDVKVVVDGTTIELYLDGELQLTYDQAGSSERLFQVVTRDEATGDVVAKVVNTTTSPVRTDVTVSDVDVEPTATVTTLAAAPSATNTKADPNRVKPRTREVSGISEEFTYEFPASSVTFLRLHTADGVAPVVSELRVEGESARGWYADPATVRVSATDDRTVDHLEVQVDDGPWTEIAGATGTVRVTGDGLHTVSVRAVDASGNVGEVRPLEVGIDATAPVTSAAYDAAARTVTLTGADSGAGLGRIEYRLDGGAWTTYGGPVAVGDRAVTLEHRGVDALGNTEEPGVLEVPAEGAQPAATTTAAVVANDRVELGGTVRLRVRVTGGTPTGAVTVLAGDDVLASGALTGGRATLRVPAAELGAGRHTLTVRYAGDAAHAASEDAVGVRVLRASSRTEVTVRGRTTTRTQATVRVQVAAAVAAAGTVRVVVRSGGSVLATRTVALRRGGDATATLPRLRAGGYRVTATYAGSADVAPSSGSTALRVTKAGR